MTLSWEGMAKMTGFAASGKYLVALLVGFMPWGCGGAVTSGPETAGTGGTTQMATSSQGGTSGDTRQTLECNVDGDCTWTEIDADILKPSDCPCLFGCPHILVNTDTANRRQNQYAANCKRLYNGKGEVCPIDECIEPPVPTCVDGLCVATRQ